MMDEVDLLKRQYLQLIEPEKLTLPNLALTRMPSVQRRIYETLFEDGALLYSPPDRYKLRVLKKLVLSMEEAIADPEEDVRFPSTLLYPTRSCLVSQPAELSLDH